MKTRRARDSDAEQHEKNRDLMSADASAVPNESE